MGKEKKEMIVTRNDFIESNLTGTPAQNRILIELLSNIKIDDDGFEILEFELKNHVDASNSKEVANFIKNLKLKSFVRDNDEKKEEFMIFSKFTTLKDTRILQAQLSENIRPMLLELEKNFTKYFRSDAEQTIGGTYNYKLFQLLKKNSYNGNECEWICELSKFRFYMNIDEEQYQKFSNFENRVLKPALESNQKLFLGLSCEKIKRGRFVYQLKFTWRNEDYIKKIVNKDVGGSWLSGRIQLSLSFVNGTRGDLDREALTRNVFNHRVSLLKKVMFSELEIIRILCLPNSVTDVIKSLLPVPNTIKNPKAYVISKIKEKCDPKGIFYEKLVKLTSTD